MASPFNSYVLIIPTLNNSNIRCRRRESNKKTPHSRDMGHIFGRSYPECIIGRAPTKTLGALPNLSERIQKYFGMQRPLPDGTHVREYPELLTEV